MCRVLTVAWWAQPAAVFAFLCLLLVRSAAAQILVTSVDARNVPVYFCGDHRENEVQIAYAIVNLSTSSLRIDSISYRWTRQDFTEVYPTPPFILGSHGYSQDPGPTYLPSAVGLDTFWVIAHFGIDSSVGMMLFESKPSPSAALIGVAPYFYDYALFGFGGHDVQLRTDTLHDPMKLGPTYQVSTTPQPHGDNEYVCLKACGGALIDSIVLRDTFTEFSFHNLPTGPVSVAAGDSLTIHYDFVPSIVGQHARPMVFYMHDGSTMVWEFEYTVRPASAVATDASEARYRLYPNPASTNTTLQLADDGIARATRILDINGRPVTTTFRVSGTGLALPVTNLPSGVYRVEIKSEQSVDYLPLVLRH